MGGWPAPVLFERSEFSGASIFWFVFVAIDKNEQAPRVEDSMCNNIMDVMLEIVMIHHRD